MKKIFLLLVTLSLAGLNSCEKDNSDAPGQIQGMGNTAGKLQVEEQFTMPDGIHLVGEIEGLNNPVSKSGELKSSYDSKSAYSYYGSGKYVRLKLNLLNSKNYPRTVFFPKGLIWECKTDNFQHGLQIQTSWISMQPNSSRTIIVDLYCVNQDRDTPNETGTYNILGVTSSKVLKNLLSIIGWKKVNYEMIYGNNSGKGVEAVPTYEEITERLQAIVYNLTDKGIDISAEDRAFIEGIPELASEERPVVDENSMFPEYFEEFKVPE